MNSENLVSDFDIVSFFVALAVIFYSFTKYSEQSLGNRAFKRLVFCAMLLCVTDYLACLSIKLRTGTFLECLLYSIYIFSFVAFSQSSMAYTNAYIFTKNEAIKERMIVVKVFFPTLVLLLAANAWTGFLFYIEDDYSVVKGPAYFCSADFVPQRGAIGKARAKVQQAANNGSLFPLRGYDRDALCPGLRLPQP